MYYVDRFLDGTIPTPEYLRAVGSLVSAACAAEEQFPIDELEETTRKQDFYSQRVEEAKKEIEHAINLAAWYATVQLDEEVEAICGPLRDPDGPLKEKAYEAFVQLQFEAEGRVIWSSPWRCDADGNEFRYVIKTYAWTRRRGLFKELAGDRFIPVLSVC